jgi:hypothetical protein
MLVALGKHRVEIDLPGYRTFERNLTNSICASPAVRDFLPLEFHVSCVFAFFNFDFVGFGGATFDGTLRKA